MGREVLGRQWDNSEVGQALRHDLGVKRVDGKKARHPRSGFQVDVGVHPGSPVPGSSPPMQKMQNHGQAGNRLWGMTALQPQVPDRPIKHVYRGVSEEDYQGIMARGHIQSDKRGNVCESEGTCASHDPRSAAVYGGDVSNFRVLKIRVHPDDGWHVPTTGDTYIKTHQPIPVDRIVRVTRPLQSPRGRLSK